MLSCFCFVSLPCRIFWFSSLDCESRISPPFGLERATFFYKNLMVAECVWPDVMMYIYLRDALVFLKHFKYIYTLHNFILLLHCISQANTVHFTPLHLSDSFSKKLLSRLQFFRTHPLQLPCISKFDDLHHHSWKKAIYLEFMKSWLDELFTQVSEAEQWKHWYSE